MKMTKKLGELQVAEDIASRKRRQARERKQRFDQRMKNADGSYGPERRFPVVIYLTKRAKEVLKLGTEGARNPNKRKMHEADVLEYLLLEFGKRLEAERKGKLASQKNVAVEHNGMDVTAPNLSSLIHASRKESKYKREPSSKLVNAVPEGEEELTDDAWTLATNKLFDAHRALIAFYGFRLVSQLREDLQGKPSHLLDREIISRVLGEYISDLIEAAMGNGVEYWYLS
jgi:hypothetical protein